MIRHVYIDVEIGKKMIIGFGAWITGYFVCYWPRPGVWGRVVWEYEEWRILFGYFNLEGSKTQVCANILSRQLYTCMRNSWEISEIDKFWSYWHTGDIWSHMPIGECLDVQTRDKDTDWPEILEVEQKMTN